MLSNAFITDHRMCCTCESWKPDKSDINVGVCRKKKIYNGKKKWSDSCEDWEECKDKKPLYNLIERWR